METEMINLSWRDKLADWFEPWALLPISQWLALSSILPRPNLRKLKVHSVVEGTEVGRSVAGILTLREPTLHFFLEDSKGEIIQLWVYPQYRSYDYSGRLFCEPNPHLGSGAIGVALFGAPTYILTSPLWVARGLFELLFSVCFRLDTDEALLLWKIKGQLPATDYAILKSALVIDKARDEAEAAHTDRLCNRRSKLYSIECAESEGTDWLRRLQLTGEGWMVDILRSFSDDEAIQLIGRGQALQQKLSSGEWKSK